MVVYLGCSSYTQILSWYYDRDSKDRGFKTSPFGIRHQLYLKCHFVLWLNWQNFFCSESESQLPRIRGTLQSSWCCRDPYDGWAYIYLKQLLSLLKSHTSGLARICMVDDRIAGHCTGDVGISLSVGNLWHWCWCKYVPSGNTGFGKLSASCWQPWQAIVWKYSTFVYLESACQIYVTPCHFSNKALHKF